MNSKQFVYIVALVILAMSLSFSTLMLLNKFEPEWTEYLNFDSDSTSTRDTIILEPTVEITEERRKYLESEVEKRIELQKTKDSLNKIIKQLIKNDSLKDSKLNEYKDSLLPEKIAELDSSVNYGKELEDSINRLTELNRQAKNEIELAQQRLEEQKKYIEEEIDSTMMENYIQTAKIYNNSNPADVAEILERLPERDAALLLNLMSKRKAGKVIESMDPERAAMIILLQGAK